MRVQLKPEVVAGHRSNTGKVGIILRVDDQGRAVRVYIGDEPVDVTGCKCVVLAGCLKSGKLIEVGKDTDPSPKKTGARAPSKTQHFDKD